MLAAVMHGLSRLSPKGKKINYPDKPMLREQAEKRKEEHARVGISVGKKLGNAVCRNKVKRQVRSMVDHLFNFEEEYDLIIIVRPRYHLQDFAQNEKELATNKIRIEKKMKR